MKIKKIVFTLVAFGLSLLTAKASEGTQPYENYLNHLKTLSGDFTQINSKGQQASGTLQIFRPGKMRLTYNPPSTLLIVANGKWLITKDREADQVDYVSLDKTPAAFILRPQVRFSGDVEVTSVLPKGETTEISLIRKEDPDSGYITLVFNDNPIALKEWRVIDGQGIETRVILSNIQSNIPLPANLFAIESPSLIQQIF
ncbi:MAG: outer membrane lipoprotein carrier protein LolA [Alphaproteobacteria bacterium]|nr:outer membrane lipoprotein carrier protein LolA [Alphaproteobacteria bacterium]